LRRLYYKGCDVLKVEAAVRSHLGCVRRNNEDNFYLNGVYMLPEQRDAGGLFKVFCEDKRQLYAICDGMGGMNKGEEASLRAVSNLGELAGSGRRGFAAALQAYINSVSGLLGSLYGQEGSAGCTLASVYFDGPNARTAHLGDSRIYFKRSPSELIQLTSDHSQAEWYVRQGILSRDEAAVHPSRNTLRRYLGAPVPEGREPDISDTVKVKGGDIFLLCSDGLSDLVNTHEIDGEISKGQNCPEVCKSLTSLAIARGGNDNITVMMLRVT
jgi:protein phosphatase